MLDAPRLRWALWRNRLIASPAVRALTSWFPWPARRYARALFDLTAGFVYSQIAKALIESGLLDRLESGPASLAEAGKCAELPESAVSVLLKAAAALGLAEEHGGQWVLGPQGAALAATAGVSEMIRHHQLLYADLANPLAMLRGEGEGRLARLWRYDGSANPDDISSYSALMAASQPMVAAQAIAAYSFRSHCRLLDVGGGTGAFLEQIARAAPNLELGLFDRPHVIERAKSHFGTSAALFPGSFLDDPLPAGFDLITLVRVLHDHDDELASRLLRSVWNALPPGGRVLIVEPLAGTPGAEPMGHAYFGFYLAAMRSGRPRMTHEYKQMLHEAGFKRVKFRRTPLPLVANVIVGQK